MKNLRTWHITLGGFTDKVSPFEMEDGIFEMVAVDDVKKDDIVAFIPADLIMTVAHAKDRSKNVQALEEVGGVLEKMKSGTSTVTLALYVME